ncbi:hypothetical protein BJ925_0515 [Rahnella aquatilis]|nr:hypothetical protein BJ925_0515 [Rahnella aquatilis]
MSVFTNPNTGYVYDLPSSVFETQIQDNLVISSLNLFTPEYHGANRIALDKLLRRGDQSFNENPMYTASEFNTTKRSELGSYLYQLKYTSALDSVTSRDIEQYRSKRGYDIPQSIQEVVSDFFLAQNLAYQNYKEQVLTEAVLGQKVTSEYAEQGDLDYLTEYNLTKTNMSINISDDANIPQQLDEIWRKIRVMSIGFNNELRGAVILASGDVAQALKYHKSITDAMLYVLSPDANTNFYTQYTELLSAYSSWKFKNFTIVDITGNTLLENYIGANGAVVIPRFTERSGINKCHFGVGTKHATLGKALEEVHSYVTYDDKWNMPTIVTESSLLPIMQLPQTTVFITPA